MSEGLSALLEQMAQRFPPDFPYWGEFCALQMELIQSSSSRIERDDLFIEWGSHYYRNSKNVFHRADGGPTYMRLLDDLTLEVDHYKEGKHLDGPSSFRVNLKGEIIKGTIVYWRGGRSISEREWLLQNVEEKTTERLLKII